MYKVLQTYAVYYYDRVTGPIKIEQLDRIAALAQEYNISSEEQSTAQIISNQIDMLKTNYANIWKTYVFVAENSIELKDVAVGIIEQILRLTGIELRMNEKGQVPVYGGIATGYAAGCCHSVYRKRA